MKIAIVLIALLASYATCAVLEDVTTTAAPTTTVAPTTTTPPTCQLFETTKYGAPNPAYSAVTVNGNSVEIAITMSRQTINNDDLYVRHLIDTKYAGSNQCLPTDTGAVPSVGVNWVVTTPAPCLVTYTLTQSLEEIVSSGPNNNWETKLAPDGTSIMYTLPVYMTYSVGTGINCYYVSSRIRVSFQTKLSVTATVAEFTTADNFAKFRFSGLRITPENTLEIAGTIIPLISTIELRNISLYRVNGNVNIPTPTTSCDVYPAGCEQLYSIPVTELGGFGTDISGQYNTMLNIFEAGNLTAGANITYVLSYTIPADPSVIDSDTITTFVSLFSDSSYSTLRTASYNSAVASLYLENGISATSPTIPSNLRLRMTEGYLCCVNYATSISPYNPNTDTGGCKDAVGKVEWAFLGNETAQANGVSLVSASASSPKRYRLQVALNQVYTSLYHENPLSCEVLMISKLEGPQARRVNAASNLNSEYYAVTPFSVAATAQPSTVAPTTAAVQITQVPNTTAAKASSSNVVRASVALLAIVLVSMLL